MDQKKLNETTDRLGVVMLRYTSFEEMIACPDIDAVLLVSSSALHAGKHVFSEKTLGVTVPECKEAEKAVEAHPELMFMLGFMRRFDESYRYAHDKVVAGEIGQPVLFRSYSEDPEQFIEGASPLPFVRAASSWTWRFTT